MDSDGFQELVLGTEDSIMDKRKAENTILIYGFQKGEKVRRWEGEKSLVTPDKHNAPSKK